MNQFNVRIGDTNIKNGMHLSLEKSKEKPKINFNNYDDKYYTIIVMDPDAPSHDNPIYKYWLHYLTINNNNKIIEYESPDPPKNSGIHRYFFILLKQKEFLEKKKVEDIISKLPKKRQNFNYGEFVSLFGFEPIDSVYFETENK